MILSEVNNAQRFCVCIGAKRCHKLRLRDGLSRFHFGGRESGGLSFDLYQVIEVEIKYGAANS